MNKTVINVIKSNSEHSLKKCITFAIERRREPAGFVGVATMRNRPVMITTIMIHSCFVVLSLALN